MSKTKYGSLRTKFLKQILSVIIIIAIVSSVIQLYTVNKQIEYETENKSMLIADSIEQGIKQTELASRAIEHQIDLKMNGYNEYIAKLLGERSVKEISNEELIAIRDQLNLDGITLFSWSGDDIAGVKSTDPEEIGFGLKAFGEEIFGAARAVLEGKVPNDAYATYTDPGVLVLPIAQSGSKDDGDPIFFKYAYYHPPGTDYYISSFITSNEVYRFTEEVGPDSWITQLVEEKSFVKEVGVLNPKVFANPNLKEEIYPPLEEVVFGQFEFQTEKDKEVLISMKDQLINKSYVEKYKGQQVYKMFLPINEDRVIYIALDYSEIIGPIYKHAIILFITNMVILLVLFLLTAKFFNGIYENIQRIRTQIKLLASGDFTAKSNVKDNTELGHLSESEINRYK